MRRSCFSLVIPGFAVVGAVLSIAVPSLASVVGTGNPMHAGSPDAVQTRTSDEFFVHPPPLNFPLAHRDLEFQVDALYQYPNTVGLTSDQVSVLDALATSIAGVQGSNSFGLPMGHLQLVYEYLRQPYRQPYDTNPQHTGFTTGRDSVSFTVTEPVNEPIPIGDRSNVDYYVYQLNHDDSADPIHFHEPRHGGEYPSAFAWQKEDSTTGHWISPTNYHVFHDNSLMYNGPAALDAFSHPGSNGWNASNNLADTEFGHEFQHSLRYKNPNFFGGSGWYQMDEVFSTVAEQLVGMADPDAGFEVPYTWPIMQTDNYQNWRLLSSYLLFNFLGADTTRTASGITDDLVYRWSRTSRRFWDLAELLSNQASPELAGKSYFQGLDNSSRLSLLLHDWRVANYVNNASLAEGQYGFANAYSPWSLKPWQSFDGVTGDDDVAVPPEVTARRAWATQDTTISLYRYQTAQGTPLRYPMFLEGYGAEYWVVRSDASLQQGQQDLVVRVTPEGAYHGREGPASAGSVAVMFDGRLLTSAVAYSQQDTLGVAQPLWRHPNWASAAIAPTWVDVDSAAGALEFVIPNFGTTNKAAVVVLSLGDGPLRGLSRIGHKVEADTTLALLYPRTETLPYRINFAIRATPYQAQNPLAVAQTANAEEDFPTWSPAGDEIAYVKYDGGNYTRIFRSKLDGSTPVPLFPTVTYFQSHPDWSPRGDRVAFDQVLNPTHTDIWIANTASQAVSQVTNSMGQSIWPVFQPNGQGLAYIRFFQRSWQSPDSLAVQGFRSEIHTVMPDGTLDVTLVASGSQHFASPRWAADGASIYFASHDTLYNVRLSDHLVTVAAGPNGDMTSFDVPLGTGPRVIEEPGTFYYSRADGPNPDSTVAFRRVALRDGSGDAQARFYRTSAEFANPRWSFDGTRIAYSSNQNNVNDRDVFVGQVSYDHPPVFTDGVGDAQVEQGLPFDRTLVATDPDGETITFAAAYLPPGATLDPVTGHLHWNVPANSAGQTYYVTLRALDPSWGVANKVVKIDVIQGGGCPFADTWTASGWQAENSILGRSLTGALALDSYRLKATPAADGGRYRVRLRENEQESTTLDQVRLAYVDHAPDQRAWALGEKVVLGTWVPPYQATTSTGKDITSLVNGSGAGFFQGQPGDTVLIDLVKPGSAMTSGAAPGGGFDPFDDGDGGKGGGGGGGRAVMGGDDLANRDAVVLGSTGILIQGRDASGLWSTIRQRYPREYNDEFLVDTLDQGPVRMVFVGSHRLNHVGRVIASGAVVPQVLDLLSAQHSRLGDVSKAVAGAGDATTALSPGDTLSLEFAATPVPAGQVRDFFLLSKGVYTSAAVPLTNRPVPGASAPTRFALLQNRPNPFTGGTMIGFELPRVERVRIEVFDPQGRQVRVLADGSYAPGRWSVEWDHRDTAGRAMSPGVYLYRMTSGTFRDQRKMVLIP